MNNPRPSTETRLAGICFPLLLATCLAAAGCTTTGNYAPFDSQGHLRARFAERLGASQAENIEIPYSLDAELYDLVHGTLSPTGGEQWRVDQVLDFIFHRTGLEYARTPTRSAVATYHFRRGNCLSFVNLFVGVARQLRLNPFYVEVQDYQRWSYHDGTVVSSGHIVAGLHMQDGMRTFDFLPYQTKSYKNFKPIDDLQATAHYYNNLGAEALLAGEGDQALELLEIAAALAPDFDRARSNLGVALMRLGRLEEAVSLYETALERSPKDVALLSNLARAYQHAGRRQEAMELLANMESLHQTHPFFFIYRGEAALAQGDLDKALQFMVKALRRDSEIPDVHLGLAKVYLALGDLRRAQHHVGRALRLDATHNEARSYAALLKEAADVDVRESN